MTLSAITWTAEAAKLTRKEQLCIFRHSSYLVIPLVTPLRGVIKLHL
jgi:hypothetical protein